MDLTFCVACDPGMRRTNNEDSFCARPDLGLFAVADGLGGHEAGEVASRTAIDAVQQTISETAGFTERSRWPVEYQPALGVDGNRLNWAFQVANDRVRAAAESGGRPGMATTIAAVLLKGSRRGSRPSVRGATIGHIGDSRVYRLHGGRLGRLTRDHSWVEEDVKAGKITDGEARVHPQRNMLTRALTGVAEALADFLSVDLVSGDQLLLCSDGLHAVVSDDAILEILTKQDGVEDGEQTVTQRADPDETLPAITVATTVCDALVRAANAAGGPDNITAVLIRV